MFMRGVKRAALIGMVLVVAISVTACADKAIVQKPKESAALLKAVKQAQTEGMVPVTEKFFAIKGRKTVDYDADNDGKIEKLVVFLNNSPVNADTDKPDKPNNLVVILKQDADGVWKTMWKSQGQGYEFAAVKLLDIRGNGKKMLFLNQKYGVSAGNILDIYGFDGTEMQMQEQFANHRFEAVKAADGTQLFAIWLRDSGEAYSVELYGWNGEKIASAEKYYKQYFKQVAEYYKKLYDENKKSSVYAYYYADALCKTGDFKQASEIAQIAISDYAAAPGYALRAAVVRSQAYEGLGDTSKAAVVLERDMDAISADWGEGDFGEHPLEIGDAWYQLAVLKHKLGDKTGAEFAAKNAYLILSLMSDTGSVEKIDSLNEMMGNVDE